MSTPDFGVSAEKMRWLTEKMAQLAVKEEDLQESFVRSSGCGGQHVNKTSSRVQIRHIPTGTTASSQQDRSQSVNRFLARRLLLEKLSRQMGLATKEDCRIAKLKKQKARRGRKSAKKHSTETK